MSARTLFVLSFLVYQPSHAASVPDLLNPKSRHCKYRSQFIQIHQHPSHPSKPSQFPTSPHTNHYLPSFSLLSSCLAISAHSIPISRSLAHQAASPQHVSRIVRTSVPETQRRPRRRSPILVVHIWREKEVYLRIRMYEPTYINPKST